MGITAHATVPTQHRFSWVVEGRKAGPDQPYDRDLFGFSNAAVTPTKGAIVANWMLVIPRKRFRSVADLPYAERRELLEIITNLVAEKRLFPNKTFFFEHGARLSDSVVGCGVDQAHVHVVSVEFDLLDLSLKDEKSGVHWRETDALDPWSKTLPYSDYYMISDLARTFVGFPIRGISQYFRRLIDAGQGRPLEWDYREFPNERNARRTARIVQTASG